MQKTELIAHNPLRLMGYDSEDVLAQAGFGAIIARAGVGKTAFVVQLAINKMLRDQNVLHIGLADPVEKVTLWYEEVFRNIAAQCQVTMADPIWESILPKRFIMTFKVEGFSVPKLQERLDDLTRQDIFVPRMILIDGLPIEGKNARQDLEALKALAVRHGVHVWFTVRTHRHETPEINGVPQAIVDVSDLFDVILQLQPEDKEIRVRAIKGGPARPDAPRLLLDPSTLLIKDK
jgi:hypothetical protein